MSIESKKRLVYGALLALTLWPIVHLSLVQAFDVSPWKLAGWGMYSAPRTGAGFQVMGRGAPGEEFRPVSVPESVLDTARRFHRQRRWLGELASPDDLGAEMLAAAPHLVEVAILVERPVLSTETGFIEATRTVYRFPR